MILSNFLSRETMIKVINMKSFLYPLTCKTYYMLSITICMKLNRKT